MERVFCVPFLYIGVPSDIMLSDDTVKVFTTMMEQYHNVDASAQESRHRESSVEGYVREHTISLENGSVVQFMGVQHHPETLRKFGEEIEGFIREADVLITELGMPEKEEDMSAMEEFYRKIFEIAKKYNVEMRVPDPEKTMSDAAGDRVVDGMPVAIASIAFGYSFLKTVKMLNDERMKRQYPGWKEQYGKGRGMTRRNFLKVLGGGVLAAAGTMNAVGGALLENGKTVDREGTLRKFIHSSIDYRNACIAREILRAAKKTRDVRVIYGEKHYSGVREHIEHPEDIESAIALYEKTYGRISSPGTDVYNADTQPRR